MLHRIQAEAWTVYSLSIILMVSTTMPSCPPAGEPGQTVYPYLVSPSPKTCLQNTIHSFESFTASVEDSDCPVEDNPDQSRSSRKPSSAYGLYRDILESYSTENIEDRPGDSLLYLQPVAFSTSNSPSESIRERSSRQTVSSLQTSRSTLRQFPELVVNTTSVKPQLPIRLKDMVAQERALEGKARGTHSFNRVVSRSASPKSEEPALLQLRESCSGGNDGFQRLRTNKRLSLSLRSGRDIQERPMSSFSYSSDETSSSSTTLMSKRRPILPRLGSHFSLASKKRKSRISVPSTSYSASFQAFKKGRRGCTSTKSHRNFPRRLLILSPRLSKGPEPMTATCANILPNTSRKLSGPQTPYPRKGFHVSLALKSPVTSKVADSLHIGTCQIRSILDKARHGLAQTSQERRRMDLKRSIVRVGEANHCPDGHVKNWI